MRKLSVVLAALAASPACVMAQTVQVYGVLDGGISRVTGLAGGADNAVVSGIMDGSRLGFKGTEDLGGGYRALFTMEHRLEIDTGGISSRPPSGSQLPDRLSSAALLFPNLTVGQRAALQPIVNGVAPILGSRVGTNQEGNFWDRQVYVGIVTPFGGFLVGRQYSPAYEVAAAFDTTGTQSSLSAGQVATLPGYVDIRVSNAVAYRIEKGPLSGALMFAPSESGSTPTGRTFGINGLYKTGAFSLGVGYNARDNELGDKSLTTLVLGASASVGPGTLVTLFTAVKDDNPGGLSILPAQLAPQVGAATAALVHGAYVEGLRQKARHFHVGYRLSTGPHTFYTAFTALNDLRPVDADVRSYGGVYSYSLSKRTDVNFVLTHFDNRNLAQTAPGQAGFVGGVTASAGKDSNNVAVGLRHRF